MCFPDGALWFRDKTWTASEQFEELLERVRTQLTNLFEQLCNLRVDPLPTIKARASLADIAGNLFQ